MAASLWQSQVYYQNCSVMHTCVVRSNLCEFFTDLDEEA